MNAEFMADTEIISLFGEKFRNYRVAQSGMSLTREQLAARAGVSVSALERFEKGGNSSLSTLVSLFRECGLLDGLLQIVPDVSEQTPMEILENVKPNRQRAFSPRKKVVQA